MFPTNLHKNIVQLDRQISLLENECKNMEVEKRKKNSRLEHSLSSKCSKLSHLKSSPVKATLKKSSGYECPKRVKKLTPPFSTRVHSTSSIQSSKPWSEICEPVLSRNDKVCGLNTNFHVCSCQLIDCDSRKENKFVKSLCCKDKPPSVVNQDDHEDTCTEKFDESKKNQLLHKEVLFSDPDGTIEVTVVKKPNGKENSPIKRFINLGSLLEKNVDRCKCQIKGQKWSEILGLDSSRRGINIGDSTKSHIFSEETQVLYHHPNHDTKAVQHENEEIFTGNCHNEYEGVKSGIFDAPVKLAPLCKVKKSPEINLCLPEKETQCNLDKDKPKEPPSQVHDPMKLFQILVDELKQKPRAEKKQLLNDMESSVIKFPIKSPVKGPPEAKEKHPTVDLPNQKNDFMNLKQQCECLVKEKELLSEELAAKDSTIATMKKREEEYLSLISSLKSNLEKTKENAHDGLTALKELNHLRTKLLEEIKVSEALKMNLTRMQESMEKYMIENHKLRTKVNIFKLESEKHGVLLAGKEAEINRYKEEIKNFQMQISDHLESLKSDAQGVDVEKMMEAIIQQSHLFIQTDLESVILEKDLRSSSKQQQNILMHSSPTSTKTSLVNSSWKQISSIRDQDQDQGLNKANSDIEISLNEDDEKEFFQVFGEDNSSDTESSKKSKETLIQKLAEQEGKAFAAFQSCITVQDDEDRPSLSAPKEENVPSKGSVIEELNEIKQFSSQKVHSNIDELLQNMKLKWSKEVFGTSRGDSTIEDFLNNSQVSSITVNSDNLPSLETSK